MYDIIAIGDSTVDVFLFLDDASVQCEVKKDECKLCINYADKVPVRQMARVDGVGNAANNAVGVSRLGLRAALYSIIGHDMSGHAVLKTLKAENVATKFIVEDKKRGTNYSTVIDYKGERTILVYHEHRDYHLPKLPKARWIYFTSMAKGHESMYPSVVSYVKKMKPKVAFNPGTFQLKLGAKALAPILELTDVLFVNKEEAKRLLDIEEENGNMNEFLPGLATLGPKIVVITDGQKGSYCFDGSAVYQCAILEAPVVERTGCGDAYASGFMAALIHGESPREAMRWGSINAAGVIQYIGAQAGLVRKKEMMKMLVMHPEFQPHFLPLS